MRSIRSMLALLAFTVAPLLAIPGDASAGCTSDYYRCLNDSWDSSGGEELLSNLECGAEFIGCVGRKLLFW